MNVKSTSTRTELNAFTACAFETIRKGIGRFPVDFVVTCKVGVLEPKFTCSQRPKGLTNIGPPEGQTAIGNEEGVTRRREAKRVVGNGDGSATEQTRIEQIVDTWFDLLFDDAVLDLVVVVVVIGVAMDVVMIIIGWMNPAGRGSAFLGYFGMMNRANRDKAVQTL